MLNPFLAPETAMKVAKGNGRNGYGYKTDLELAHIASSILQNAQIII
ncbi:MAG: hypothetical protein QXK89_10600 [Candidatus Bathyarchaeia archaeon]